MNNNSVKIPVQDCQGETKPCLNHTMLSSCPLLDIEARDARIEDVCALACTPLSQTTTADPCYIFQVLACCQKMETCLKGWFGPQILSRLTHRCSLIYKGNINTNRIIIDLDRCHFDFEGLSIKCGHQTLAL
jgi:hypothetical protein